MFFLTLDKDVLCLVSFFLTLGKEVLCRVFFLLALDKQICLPSVFCVSLSKRVVCRVPEGLHSAKYATLGNFRIRGSDRSLNKTIGAPDSHVSRERNKGKF